MRIRHGGELRQFSEKFGIPEREILDFSSNINPFGPPASVREVFETSFDQLTLYPDPEALDFRREVARHFPLFPENVVAGNGAMELLDLILRFLRPRRALVVEPAFPEYRRLLNLQGAEVRSLWLKENEGFRFSAAELSNALRGVEVALFAHPNNPTGTYLPKEEVLSLVHEAKRKNIFVILDEAFVDWIPEISLGREIRDDSFFLVVRSLTKFYALPGIRIGYGLGSRKLAEKLRAVQPPWSCNRLAQKLAVAALRDETFAEKSREWLTPEREGLQSLLQQFPSLKVFPSAANFLLVRYRARPESPSLFDEMGRQGIYLRDLSGSAGLGAYYFRVSVRKREENQRLIEALKNYLMEQGRVSV